MNGDYDHPSGGVTKPSLTRVPTFEGSKEEFLAAPDKPKSPKSLALSRSNSFVGPDNSPPRDARSKSPVNKLTKAKRNRRSSIAFNACRKNHPLIADDSDGSARLSSSSDDSSGDEEISISRLKAKIMAIKMKKQHKKLLQQRAKANGGKSAAPTGDSVQTDESAWALARRRVAEANRIPFTASFASVIAASAASGGISLASASNESGGGGGRDADPRAPMDPSVLISKTFLQHSMSRGGGEEDNGSMRNAIEMTAKQRGDAPAATAAAAGQASRGAALVRQSSKRSGGDDESVISQLTEASSSQKSLANSAWGMVGSAAAALGLGAGQKPRQQKLGGPSVPPIKEDPAESPAYPARRKTNSEQRKTAPQAKSKGLSGADALSVSNAADSENIAVNTNTAQPTRRGAATDPAAPGQPAGRGPGRSAASSRTPVKSPPLAPIRSPAAGPMRSPPPAHGTASARTNESPSLSNRRQEAFQSHVTRYKTGSPAQPAPTRAAAAADQVNPPSAKAPRSKGKPTSRTNTPGHGGEKNQWEELPESACFISRLNHHQQQEAQSHMAAPSPFMTLVQSEASYDRYQHDEQPERQEDDEDWEDSPADMRQASSRQLDRDDEWEDSPNYDSGNEWEESPPSPMRRQHGDGRGYRDNSRSRDQQTVFERPDHSEHQVQPYREQKSSPNRGVKLSGMFEDPFSSLTSPNSASAPPRKRSPVAR
jgi:hypothetical protein